MRARWILETHHHTRAVSEMLYRGHAYFWTFLPQAGRAAGCGTDRYRTAVVVALLAMLLVRRTRRGVVYSRCAVHSLHVGHAAVAPPWPAVTISASRSSY